MSRIVRQSKFRHVFGEPVKPELQYSDLDLSPTTGDHNYVRGNTKFFSVAVRGGGGPVQVIPYTLTGKLPRGYPTINGHTAAVYDTAWNPFNEHQLATGSDDSTVKVWQIPEGGLTENMKDPLVTLSGHGKPVTLLQWHPTANGVLASASKDPSVKIWDVENATARTTIDCFGGLVQDLAWNADGSLLATSTKDKLGKIFDPRTGAVVAEWMPHEGAKAFKILFLGDRGQILTAGFSKQNKREVKIWDVKDFSKEICQVEVDQSAGTLMPFYDDDTRILYLTGKGDGNIRYYEMVDEAPYIYPLSDYRTNVSTKGADMLPKRACNALKCEVARLLKLTGDGVEPLTFIVPRKSESFQEDIYPDAYAGKPSVDAASWFGGANKAPLRMSMDPAKNGAVSASAPAAYKPLSIPTQSLAPASAPAASPVVSSVSHAPAASNGDSDAQVAELTAKVSQLAKQLAEAKDRIAELEASETKLKKAVAALTG